MKICPACNEKENDGDERFCISCGLDLDKSQNRNLQNTSNVQSENIKKKIISKETTQGRLIFSDKRIFAIDKSQRLIGRADLRSYTKKDPNLVSRSHFTIYKKNHGYFMKDGITNVQNKASENGTIVNKDKLSKNECELKNGDEILVSDVLILFEV